MKIGDKIICKKSINEDLYLKGDFDVIYNSGEEYCINNITNDAVYIRFRYNIGRWFSIGNRVYPSSVFLRFSNAKGEKVSPFKYNFKDYFYTEQEIRKMKLKKLNYVEKG